MPRTITTGRGQVLALHSPEAEAAIQAGIEADPDAAALPDAQWEQGRPLVRRGRPPVAERRPTLNMRIDADVLASFKATGRGWQTRINALLREAVQQGRVKP